MSKKTENQIINLETNLTEIVNLEIPDPLSPDFEESKRYGDYTRIEEGQNTLRVLSEGIYGVEYWIESFDQETNKMKKKPVRVLETEASNLETPEWAYFYAFFVWNYTANKIQILSTTKRGILKGIRNLIKNQKWGDITGYDICINKVLKDPSDSKSAEYSVTPEPKAVLDSEILEKWEKSNFNRQSLLLLFEGLDPFEEMRKAREQAKKIQVKA